MRKIIVLEFMSLDGVIQAPGGPGEDTSNGFAYGGWVAPLGDDVSGKLIQQQMEAADLLLGRKTYDIFAAYWPQNADYWPGINDVTKYVLSSTLKNPEWKNSVVLTSVSDIQKLKNTNGPPIKVWGSSELVQLLLKHDLADELWLKIYPVTIGQGKKLFDHGTVPASFTVIESTVTPSGIVFVNLKRAGELKTGTIGA